MDTDRKSDRYKRIFEQVVPLMGKTGDPTARMATIAALLHHKIPYYFWTGFYLLREGNLIVHTYQGPLACQVLPLHTGVCWAGIDRNETVIVPDTHQFPGHIACDPRSRSEIVVPLKDSTGQVVGVLDIDSRTPDSFDTTDALWLEKIVNLVFN